MTDNDSLSDFRPTPPHSGEDSAEAYVDTLRSDDSSLRKAMADGSRWTLPSNFTFTTMKAVAEAERRRAHRSRVTMVVSLAAVSVGGVATVAALSGGQIAAAIAGAFSHAVPQGDGVGVAAVAAMSFVFLGALNLLLRKRLL